MSPVSRRIFLYWVLLLVPTLAAGTGAILLLRREQARLAEQGAYADEARRAAIAARTRLIVENVELLVGDVQAGLLDTLAGEPDEGIARFMEEWERTNPLVRTAFRVSADGRMLVPDATAAATDEQAQGFVRRFARRFQENPPWSVAIPLAVGGASAPAPEPKLEKEYDEARKQVASNIAQVQSARRDVQELFKVRERPASGAPAPSSAEGPALADAAAAARSDERAEASGDRSADRQRAPSLGSTRGYESTARVRNQATPSRALTARAKDAADQRGWWPVTIHGRLHVLGWARLGGVGEVRGVEVETVALISRLGGALPAEAGAGEGYALRDASGQVLHQAGAVPRRRCGCRSRKRCFRDGMSSPI